MYPFGDVTAHVVETTQVWRKAANGCAHRITIVIFRDDFSNYLCSRFVRVIAGFPAREVVIAVLGTVYAVGDEADEGTLSGRLKAATRPDGSPVFTLPMVVGLLIFYACCLQCAATLAIIRRETNTWRWPVFAWAYMTVIGYVGALLAFQIGSA